MKLLGMWKSVKAGQSATSSQLACTILTDKMVLSPLSNACQLWTIFHVYYIYNPNIALLVTQFVLVFQWNKSLNSWKLFLFRFWSSFEVVLLLHMQYSFSNAHILKALQYTNMESMNHQGHSLTNLDYLTAKIRPLQEIGTHLPIQFLH